jgi:hypothetical protein
MNEMDDLLSKVTIVDSQSKKIFVVDTRTKQKRELTDNECAKKFKQHEGCGGWFLSAIDPHTFNVSSQCTKCGHKEDRYKTCDRCSD